MSQLFIIKLLLVISLLLSTIAGYTTYRWRQEVAREKQIEDFWKQVDQKRKEDQKLLDQYNNWGDPFKKHRIP
jgi:hypothetical protein